MKLSSIKAGHILRKVFNCTETKNFWPLLRKMFYHLLKISTTFSFFFFSRWPRISLQVWRPFF